MKKVATVVVGALLALGLLTGPAFAFIDAFGSFDFQGNVYNQLPIDPRFALAARPLFAYYYDRIQAGGTGLYGIDNLNRLVSQVSGVPFYSAVGAFQSLGLSPNMCAACSSALPSLLNAVN